MEDSLSIDDLARWKVPQLRDYLRRRGLIHSSKRKDELVALAFAAHTQQIPVVSTDEEVKLAKVDDYTTLLLVDGKRIPDPFSELADGWLDEGSGMSKWPPIMQLDIAAYLLTNVQDRDLGKRLMSDYKEGKAYSYFASSWLKEIHYHDLATNSEVCVLKSESTPSERIKDIPHKIWVAVRKKTGVIESAYCTCFAGLGSTCNHVAAVLFKVEHAFQQGWTNKACTSRPCEWNQYGAKRKGVEPMRVSEMNWTKPHYKKRGKKATSINPAARKLFSPEQQSTTSHKAPSLDDVISAMFPACPNACAFPYYSVCGSNNYPPESDLNVSHVIEVTSSVSVPPALTCLAKTYSSCTTFLMNIPRFSSEEVTEIERTTRAQSKSNQWKEQRIGRITGSTAHRVMTKVNTLRSVSNSQTAQTSGADSLLALIMGYSGPPENLPALKYGRAMESEARRAYKTIMSANHSHFKVIECGLFVCPNQVYVGASPDGLVHCDCCGDGLLEIKCPYSIAHENPQNSVLPYLVLNDGKYSLRKNHNYYSQIQLQLGVARKPWCDLFIYTRHGHIIVRVGVDNERWLNLVSSAEYFFKNFVAPEMFSKSLILKQ